MEKENKRKEPDHVIYDTGSLFNNQNILLILI